jgi:flavin prenyltransferase
MKQLSAADRPLIVGITGASGTVYGIRILELARDLGLETHLILTEAAEVTAAYESPLKPAEIRALASFSYRPQDIAAPVSSGSFPVGAMVVAPCSVRSLAAVATGVGTGLLARAADVTLKERRPLVLMVRETPLHLGHLRNMVQAAEMGAVIMPPAPAFYARPQSLDEMVTQTAGRALDLLGIEHNAIARWKC